jgi:hypothetical protein
MLFTPATVKHPAAACAQDIRTRFSPKGMHGWNASSRSSTGSSERDSRRPEDDCLE